jgi:hypothetical protein
VISAAHSFAPGSSLLCLPLEQELILEHFDATHDFDLVDIMLTETVFLQKGLKRAARFANDFD